MITPNYSDVDSITLKDALPKCLKNFFRDFSVDDVMIRFIFNEEEMRNILTQSTEEKKVMQLFWILQDNPHLIKPFLNQIREWYPWLSQQVFVEISAGRHKNQYFCALERLHRNYEKHIDLNVHRMEFYWPVRLALLKLKPYNFLVLSGQLGIGKKWILLDVCSEYEVMKAMGFNIFWLDVQNCNRREDDFMALQQLQLHIEDSESTWRRLSEFEGIENKILHLQQRIRERLQQEKFKDCLLVLSGVQNSKTWRNLHLGCKIVIVTRNQKIFENLSETTAKHISVDSGFNLTECYQYFEKVLKRNRNTFPECASDIFSLSNGQPLLLSIIANNLKVNQSWSKWKNNLEDLEIPDKLNMVIEISLKVLKTDQKLLYNMLSIFPHSVQIPLKLLASLWNKTERESERILETFYKYSVVSRSNMPDRSVAYALPYIYSMYLKTFDQNTDRTILHNHIVSYYRIRDILQKRNDDELFGSCNDYFYHCIGYHLKGSNSLDLFPKLFLDFTFLGKKLRYDGFPNTILHLKHFEKEITGNDTYRQKLLSEILAFLPHAETVLLLSTDTNLLQCAMMADGLVKEEAIRQAGLYTHRIWFEDKGHFHQRRQVVRLSEKIHMIKSITADICIIALQTNDILLMDFSLDAYNDPLFLTGNQYKIHEIKLFLNDYIITLDIKGNLKVWSVMDDRRRSDCFGRNVNPFNLVKSPQMQKRRCKQLIEKNIRGPIKAFCIEQQHNNEIELHLAFANGDICIYSWDSKCEEFRVKSLPTLPTKVQNICYISKILNKYYMVLNNTGDIYFFNLCDSSQTARSFEWPKLLKLIYMGEYKKEEITIIIFVYSEKVLYLSLAPQKFELLKGDLRVVYNVSGHDIKNFINCACMSHDARFLVLGTKHGLIVFNIATQTEVLRGNISESIACVDVYPLDDNLYKYLILSASEESDVLSLFALKELENNTVAWSYHLNNLTGSNAVSRTPQLEPNVWLKGEKLFDLNQESDSVLIAVDSKNRIHEVSTTDEHKWSILLPTKEMSNITAITMCGQSRLCSYDDGDIFNITDGVFLQSFTHKSISYLQMINGEIFIASSEVDQKSAILHLRNKDIFKTFDIYFYKTFRFLENYTVFLNPVGRFVVVDLSDNFKLLYDTKDTRGTVIGGCDFQNDKLVLVTFDFTVLVYKFSIQRGNLLITCVQNTIVKMHSIHDKITSAASSYDGSLLAVGMKSGIIKVYQMETNDVRLIFCLSSHKSQIYDLKFSPNAEVLVSCSEQFCFWHVPFMLNNPIESESKQNRRSSRFRSSTSQEDDHALSSVHHHDTSTRIVNSLWASKRGTVEKPELLSCIKFIGSKAEIFFASNDFSQFYTIDNEGVYYHFRLHDFSPNTEKIENIDILMKNNKLDNMFT